MSGVRIAAWASAQRAPRELEDWFPERWDPKRAIQRDQRVLVAAVADACREAGWWSPGATVAGGLVVGVDLHGVEPGRRFLRALDGAGRTRPSEFLYCLPSTPATTLGLLLGLQQEQATANCLGLAGLAALSHGVDQIRRGRCERVVAAALSAALPPGAKPADAFRLGVALCLERGREGPAVEGPGVEGPGVEGRGVEVERCALGWGEAPAGADAATPSGGLLSDIGSGYRGLAAPGLLAVARLADGQGPRCVVHRDPHLDGVGVVALRDAGEERHGD